MASRGELILDILKKRKKKSTESVDHSYFCKKPAESTSSAKQEHEKNEVIPMEIECQPKNTLFDEVNAIECQAETTLIDESLEIEYQAKNTLFGEDIGIECQAETSLINDTLEIECQDENNLLNEALSSQLFILQSDGSLLQVEDNRTETEDRHNILSDFSFSSKEIFYNTQSLINGNERPHSTVVHHDTTNEESELFHLTSEAHDSEIIENTREIDSGVVPKSIVPQEMNHIQQSELFNMTEETHDNEVINNLVEVNRDIVPQNIVPQEINENQQPDEVSSNVAIESDGRRMLNDNHRSRKKRHMVKENDWEYKKAKILREKGKQYKGRKLVNGKNKFVVTKPQREIKDIRCKCKSTKFYCKSLTDIQRKNIFDEFWELSWESKKVYVKGLTEVRLTARARDRKEEGKSKRKFSHEFYFTVDNKKQRVCRSTFLATLNIGEWTLLNWIKGKSNSNHASDESNEDDVSNYENDVASSRPKRRESQTNGKSKREELTKRHNAMKEFFESLPQVESHYCRASSKKLYLEPMWSSKAKLYEFYCQDWCKGKGMIPLSSCSFHKMFEELNLGLYRPKKDQCDQCIAFKHNNIDKTSFDEHIRKKEEARKSKENDNEKEEHIYTTDLQSLLLCPRSNASALYYRSKLAVHNMTVFDLKTKDGYCYLWNECEGQLTANEFASILTDFIVSQLPLRNGSKKVIIYSDGCNYQNRCATLANALMHLAKRHQIIIEQKYLERGHTQMECDSMHSIIERCLKNKDINIPAEYAAICKKARKNPQPYHVKYLDHTFFRDFNKAMPVKSIRPGVGVGQPKVTDIRCLLFTEDGKISYKLNYEDHYKLLPIFDPKNQKTSTENLSNVTTSARPKRKSFTNPTKPKEKSNLNSDVKELFNLVGKIDFPQLYSAKLKIPRSKFNHLQELKMILPSDYHAFYDSLPHE